MVVKRRVTVVEDNSLMRALLADMLDHAGFEVATAATASDAIRIIQQTDPDALVVDIELGNGPSGLDLVSRLLEDLPHLGVVFLSRLPDARFAGALPPPESPNIAWLRKQDLTDSRSLIETLDSVLTDAATSQMRSDLQPTRPFAHLSRAQVEVLRMVASGLSNTEIAQARGTTIRAVEHLVRRTFQASGINAEEGNARVLAVRLMAREAGLPDVIS
jgi:DNA-binding NarL/FixJ family response regulator